MADDKRLVINLFVLDRSDSMRRIHASTISGFNEALTKMQGDQRDHPEEDHRLVLVIFNHKVSITVYDCSVDKVVRLDDQNYIPDGSTALNDATGFGIKEIQERFGDAINAGKASVFASIFTDGEENCSQHFSLAQVRSLIEELSATKRWVFVYFGANQDAVKEAQTYGIHAGNAVNYSATLNSNSRAYKAHDQMRVAYGSATRAAAAKGMSVDTNLIMNLADAAGLDADHVDNSPALASALDYYADDAQPAAAAVFFSGTANSEDPYGDAVRKTGGLSVNSTRAESGVTVQHVSE